MSGRWFPWHPKGGVYPHRKKERKKEISLPLPNVTMNKLLIEVSECDYIRKMLNKNHMGKVPSKAAKR